MYGDQDLSSRELSYQAKEALSDFIQTYPWDFFFTATFKHRLNFPISAVSKVANMVSTAGRSFIVAEQFILGGMHTHGLIWCEGSDLESRNIDRLLAVEKARYDVSLHKLGWSRVEYVENIGGSAGYCSKYLMKSTGDWNFYGDWRQLDKL